LGKRARSKECDDLNGAADIALDFAVETPNETRIHRDGLVRQTIAAPGGGR
jgi:hypothetical protein